MSRKRRKRRRQQESGFARLARRNSRWLRRLGVLAASALSWARSGFSRTRWAALPLHIGENGQEVRAGIIDGPPGARARTGSPAPNFLLPDYEKRTVRLDQFEGKAVFINFWASWCGPCRAEMPHIIRIAEEFPEDVVVLAINRGESDGAARSWTTGNNFPEDLPNFYWLVDSRELAYREYRQGNAMPQSFFLDSGGFVLREVTGALDFDDMFRTINQALGRRTRTDGLGH